MPSFDFWGSWRPFPDPGNFSADSVNLKEIDRETDTVTGVFINPSQISIQYKYENGMKESIVYTLTIQRSTGRFSESFLEEAKSGVPFLEHTGRCTYEKAQ